VLVLLRLQVQLNFALDEETSRVRSVLDFAPAYEGSTPPEIFLNGGGMQLLGLWHDHALTIIDDGKRISILTT
jgi:hypothetical protein